MFFVPYIFEDSSLKGRVVTNLYYCPSIFFVDQSKVSLTELLKRAAKGTVTQINYNLLYLVRYKINVFKIISS